MYEYPRVLELILKYCYKWSVLNVFCGHYVFQKGQNRHISTFFADFDGYLVIFEPFLALIPPGGLKLYVSYVTHHSISKYYNSA